MMISMKKTTAQTEEKRMRERKQSRKASLRNVWEKYFCIVSIHT